jgi:hypothetical protein
MHEGLYLSAVPTARESNPYLPTPQERTTVMRLGSNWGILFFEVRVSQLCVHDFLQPVDGFLGHSFWS